MVFKSPCQMPMSNVTVNRVTPFGKRALNVTIEPFILPVIELNSTIGHPH